MKLFDLVLARNHCPKAQFSSNFLKFESSYLPWPSLAHSVLWVFWKYAGPTFISWKKIHMQARAWGWVAVWKSVFVQKLLQKLSHMGVGPRSDKWWLWFLISQNNVLAVCKEKFMWSSDNKAAEALEASIVCWNFALKISLAMACFYLATIL